MAAVVVAAAGAVVAVQRQGHLSVATSVLVPCLHIYQIWQASGGKKAFIWPLCICLELFMAQIKDPSGRIICARNKILWIHKYKNGHMVMCICV
jgi:hypothetical protein